jgi:hypothetical protein
MRVGLKDLFNKKIGPKKAQIPLLDEKASSVDNKLICNVDTTIHVTEPQKDSSFSSDGHQPKLQGPMVFKNLNLQGTKQTIKTLKIQDLILEEKKTSSTCCNARE